MTSLSYYCSGMNRIQMSLTLLTRSLHSIRKKQLVKSLRVNFFLMNTKIEDVQQMLRFFSRVKRVAHLQRKKYEDNVYIIIVVLHVLNDLTSNINPLKYLALIISDKFSALKFPSGFKSTQQACRIRTNICLAY